MTKSLTTLLLTGAAALLSATTVYAGACGKMGGYGHPMKGPGYGYGYGMPMYGHPHPKMGMYGHPMGPGYAAAPAAPSMQDIVGVATAAGNFNTLISAVKAADLVEVLQGEGPYTVFAPTDEAFAKLPAGTVEGLLGDKAQLTKVLTYHVVPGKLDAQTVGAVTGMKTVEGTELPVSQLQLEKTDIMTSNGVIHVVSEVLLPQG